MRAARLVSLILTAHGSADPRSSATVHGVAAVMRRMRPGLDVRVAFCEQNSPSLHDVLAELHSEAVVTPLLLADAYHARVDIPAAIGRSGARVRQADVLGEDERLIQLLRRRVTESGASERDTDLGIVVVAVGSSRAEANVRTARVAQRLAAGTRWTSAAAFATGPHPTVAQATASLRGRGVERVLIAPWFLAHGLLTDRVAEYAHEQDISMTEPLGAHPLVAATVLDRYDRALTRVAAA